MMKKLNFLKLFLALMSFGLSHVQAMNPKEEHEKTRVKALNFKQDVKEAIELAKAVSSIKFDPSSPWLTLEEISCRDKGQSYNFYVANSFNPESLWGDIAIFPNNIKPFFLACDLNAPGFFSDKAPRPPVSHLHYEYISEESYSYFLLEKINVTHDHPYFLLHLNNLTYTANSREDFFYKTCVNYFLDKFVIRTSVEHVAWQLRDFKWMIQKQSTRKK